ncbi:tyrosine-type recombinase/integrase [Rhizobium sp. NLR9a]|nr:tyrosine-type recombinase/integrase [Rhizobium sp. NLR9a]MBX5277821.1 tyrosine-type recombinase/integrase [Rhizobium sp. NLR13a]
MARHVSQSDQDRHLSQRNGFYTYKRRVPAIIGTVDARAPIVRIALGTRDVGEARIKRDLHERADDVFWASLCEGSDHAAAEAQYKSAVARASALGFTYRHMSSILSEETGSGILSRLRALQDAKPGSPEETALLGGVALPGASLDRAFEIYVKEIVASELVGKSPEQRRNWKKVKQRAVANYQKVCGSADIGAITRADAIKFYNWWLEKIAPDPASGLKPTHSASSGNRDVGNLRVLYDAYYKHMGQKDVNNPFSGLGFMERKKKRPPFPTAWIVEKILAVGALAGLNDEARAILLILVETGARLSEIANLLEGQIHLGHNIPHIKIEPSFDPDEPFEIKTVTSIREVPLVGVALEAMRKFPKGFPRYRDKGTHLSSTLNKFLLENGLRPTKAHKVYSLRHSFEDRMKEARLDSELRKSLMGHPIDRPEYGLGGSLEWKQEGLLKMALPFDPAIV